MAARLSLTSSCGEKDDHAAVAARLQSHGPERGAQEALFGHPEDGTVMPLPISLGMASKREDAPFMLVRLCNELLGVILNFSAPCRH